MNIKRFEKKCRAIVEATYKLKNNPVYLCIEIDNGYIDVKYRERTSYDCPETYTYAVSEEELSYTFEELSVIKSERIKREQDELIDELKKKEIAKENELKEKQERKRLKYMELKEEFEN